MNLFLAFRSLFKKNRNNFIKIVSLGLGLAAGLILIAKALFEVAYDNFYPDSKNIYLVQSLAKMGSDPEELYPQVSGAVAPAIKEEVPQVLGATRFTNIQRDAVLLTANKNRLTGTVILADSCFFDIVPRPMMAGSAKEVLSRPMYALVSSTFAEKMGYDAVGKTLVLDGYPGRELTIGGVFESMPLNSSFKYDVVVSMSSISRFMWDGTNNWFGNDRYIGFVKLPSGVDPDELAPAIRGMQEKYQDISAVEAQYGVKLSYLLTPLSQYHNSDKEVVRKVKLLGWLAFALIFTAILNYVLIVISAHVRRVKEMAVYKSYGAGSSHISRLIYMEILAHLVAALVFAALTILLARPFVEELLGVSLPALLTLQSGCILLLLVAAIFIVTGLIPAKLFSSIPVAAAFRGFKQSRRNWMLSLLFIQLAAAAFLISLLMVIGLQYRMMINNNPGYYYEHTAYCPLRGTNDFERETAIEQLLRLPDVQGVSTADHLLFRGASGNNVCLPDDDRELFNIADLYGIDEHYIDLMGISMVEGKGFEKGISTEMDVIVSRSFAQRIAEIAGWSDGVVGKNLIITEHGLCRVAGVYDYMRVGLIGGEDDRPSAMFYSPAPASNILVRFHKLSGEALQKAIDALQTAMPEKDIVLTPYKDSILIGYNEERLFRNSVLTGGIIALILSLIGLLSYLRSEINRRSSEVAIRKVNGATIANVLILFAKNVFYLAVPALAVGAAVAAYVAEEWMKSFSEKVAPGLFLFILCCLAILSVTLGILTIGCRRVAVQNPVHSLKTE